MERLELDELVALVVSVAAWSTVVAWIAAAEWGELGAGAVGAFLGFEFWGMWLDLRRPRGKPPRASSAGPRTNGTRPGHHPGRVGRRTSLRGS